MEAQSSDAQAGPPEQRSSAYFPRRFRFTDEKDQEQQTDDDGVQATSGAKIVLGEPGMGKSTFMEQQKEKHRGRLVTAAHFISTNNPARFVQSGKPLLIDGLDEAMARHEGDVVDRILAKLEDIDCQNFILCCRAREWQPRFDAKLREYGHNRITVFTLEPFSRDDALEFLRQNYPTAPAEDLLHHLDQHSLTDIYTNPLTLGLLGTLAKQTTTQPLPATRAALFEQVCQRLRCEHNESRQDTALAQLDEASALSAAGALAAGLILSGSDAISLKGSGQTREGDISIAELAKLPGAEAARTIILSKLFVSAHVGRVRPIHRVIGEYLGARWLAEQAQTPRAQRRLLAQFQAGAIPTSWRGIHAWLAVHNSALAEPVVKADPYSVLRYVGAAELCTSQALLLFDALEELSKTDPFFRAADWGKHPAAGLMTPQLRDRIAAVIGSASSSTHLRSLLIEALKGTELAVDLRAALQAVILSDAYFSSERLDAAEALLPHCDPAWWIDAIATLRDRGTMDSTKLALNMIELVDYAVTDTLLVSTIFADLGVLVCPLPRADDNRLMMGLSHPQIVKALEPDRLPDVLNEIISYAGLLVPDDEEAWTAVASLMVGLIMRVINAGVAGANEAADFWLWLQIPWQHRLLIKREKEQLEQLLDTDDDLRHAIQEYALSVRREEDDIYQMEFYLRRSFVGFGGRQYDVVRRLDLFKDADNRDQALRKDWCDLMRAGLTPEGIPPAIRDASRPFQGDDPDLAAFIFDLENPKKSDWLIEQEQWVARIALKKEAKKEKARCAHLTHRPRIRAGELAAIIGPAKIHLGHYSNVNNQLPAEERIADFLGADLQQDAFAGFEAALHRPDLPTADQIVASLIEGKIYNYCHVLLAGFLERLRTGKNFADLSPDVQKVGLLICLEPCLHVSTPTEALRAALEPLVIPTEHAREEFARCWIEPYLQARHRDIHGLFVLSRDETWFAAAGALAGGWLADFSDLPECVESQLVECLLRAGRVDTLCALATDRATTNFRSHDNRLTWLAVDVLVRFEAVRSQMVGIGQQHPNFLWSLRDRLDATLRKIKEFLLPAQAAWIISEFRHVWPYAVLNGVSSGDTNPHDATDFLRGLIGRLANDSSDEATQAFKALIDAPEDSYSDYIRHFAAQQHQNRADRALNPLQPTDLKHLLNGGPPTDIDDLKALVFEELTVAQNKLKGDSLDPVNMFWDDSGKPYNENYCRDRLAVMIEPELRHYQISQMTEADMPHSKRADLAFCYNQMQLPLEIKGQWHDDVWNAATHQLDAQYLKDWHSEGRGIYCVLWFGDLPQVTGRRLKPHPDGLDSPTTPEEMREMLIDRIPPERRDFIAVVVLDLISGRSTKAATTRTKTPT